MKNIVIIKSENVEIINAIQLYFKNKNVNIELKDKDEFIENADLVILTGYETQYKNTLFKVINIHPSLLPAFANENAIQEAYTSVKVSGVTVHFVNSGNFFGKILAQYPILIGNTTHVDEFCSEIDFIAKNLYPVVIDAVLNDKVFDFPDLIVHRTTCSGNCCGCGNH